MEHFGSYRLVERIGSGGMCEVFRARHQSASHDVALKRLHAKLEQHSEIVDLFLTEADLGVLLEHPNLVNTLDADEIDGRYYIVMELIDGFDLSMARRLSLAHEHPVELALALHITIELLHGLDYLHQARSPAGRAFGLVHRDVSPENVFLTRRGEIKLADFGITKIGELETVTTVLGGVKGKLSYMAPEQIRGEHLDGRADMFAAALIMYELVTGHRPYARREEESEVEHAVRVREADIPAPSKLEPDLDPVLDRILRKALQRRPVRRFDSCADFAFELENYVVARDLVLTRKDVATWVALIDQTPS